MQSTFGPRSDRAPSQLVVGSLAGAGLVVIGLGLPYLFTVTPLVDRLVPTGSVASSPISVALAVWSLSLVAGIALLTAGTNRLAVIVASVRSRADRRVTVVRALGTADGINLLIDVVVNGGRPIPVVAIGPFGIAIVHEMSHRDRLRRVGEGWETREDGRWVPTEGPVDRVARDAERIRHWLTQSDLDFVVRVYAVLITSDGSIARTPHCAVIGIDQIRPWIAALPRQRSLSEARRDRLRSRLSGAASDRFGSSGW